MFSLSEKQQLIQALLERLRGEYETLLAAQRATQEGATHEEAKPENDKDTRALEQTYLARGQATRVVQLRADLTQLERLRPRPYSEDSKLGLSAIVELEDPDGAHQLYFLVPSGAGEVIDSSRGLVKVVTPESPLGRALVGARLGDDIELQSPKGKRIMSLVAVC